jgi:hypothetical protein
MPVAEELFEPILTLYRDLPAEADNQGSYLVDHRAEIKLLLDSIWEQALTNILHTKPRNHLEAQLHLNQARLDLLPSHDVQVLQSLLAVLDDYAILAGDPYIDRSKPLTRLFQEELRNLCINLSAHPAHRTSTLARNLRTFLMRVSYGSST